MDGRGVRSAGSTGLPTANEWPCDELEGELAGDPNVNVDKFEYKSASLTNVGGGGLFEDVEYCEAVSVFFACLAEGFEGRGGGGRLGRLRSSRGLELLHPI